MIVWTTAREVAFEKVCSSSSSDAGIDFNDGGIQGGRLFSFGFTNGFTTGHTQNATGYTQSSIGSASLFGERADVSSTYTSTTNFFPVGTVTYSDVTLGYIIDNFQSGSFYTSGSITFAAVTTTTDSLMVIATITTSYEYEDSTQYAVVGTTTTTTRHTITENGTTIGNARDTVVLAASNEVLWVIDENPEWSKPLTDNAVSATRTTISDLREVVGLVTAADPPQTIDSSESISSYTFTGSSASSMTVTVNYSPALVNAETVTQDIGISVAGAAQSGEFRVSGQAEVVYAGGTETVAASSATIATATQTDVLGGSWQKTALVYSTVANTRAIDNAAPSSCAGNTTKEVGVVGGNPAIASPPSMTVYSPAGVKLGDGVGLRFTGDGISETDIEEGSTITISYLQTANDGELTRYTTASPVVQSWVTLSSNSFTYLTTTLEDGETVDTELSGEFGIDGATWQEVARTRGDGLLGGDLAESETALMRINRGLYKNQSGGTSFFEGNDTTYVGTKDTTYWYPISYLQPAFYRGVVSVFRNTTTWPSA